MGNLAGALWLEPDENVAELKDQLRQQFGQDSLGALLGRIEYHSFHDAFLKITELCFAEQGPLLALLQGSTEVCNIMIG